MAVSAGSIFLELQVDDSGMVTGIKRAGNALQTFQQSLNQTTSAARRMDDAHESLGTRFRHLVVTMGNLRFVAMDIHDVFMRLPLAILKTSGELERIQKLLSGLSTASTQAGKNMEAASNFKFITDMAQKAPFQIKSLSDAFVKFKSAGLDPTNGSLQALVDGVAKFGGNGESLQRASVAIQQMAGKGVVSMEELRQQLGEAIPTAMQSMATGMGLSMAELTKAVSKGTVEAKDAIAKMLIIMGQDSQGAAKDMMDTWVGVQEQLKTRLSLAAKEVTEAGFGEASKKMAREISEGLESIQFKQITDSLGSGLADVLANITTAAKFIIQHKDEIKLAAEAWIAYKVATRVIAPVLSTVSVGMQNVNKEYRLQQAASAMTAAQVRTDEMMKAQAAGQAAQAQMQSTAKIIASLNDEMAQREAQRAKLQANYAAVNQTLQSYAPQGAYGPLDRAAVQEYQRNLVRLDAENSAAMRRIRGEIDKVSTAHADAARQVMQHGNSIDNLAGTAARASTGLTALATAGRVAGTVFNALGGWVTVLSLALTAGISLFVNWGKAAEEAAARARRAKNGLSDEADKKSLQEDSDRAGRELQEARRRLASMEERGFDRQGKRYLKQKELVERLAAEESSLAVQLSQAKVTVARTTASEEARNMVRIADDETDKIKANKTKRLLAMNEAFEAELKAAGDNKAKQAALREKHKNDRFSLEKETDQQIVDELKKQLTGLKKRFDGPEGKSAVQAAEVLTQRIEEAQTALQTAINASGKNKILNPADGKPAKESMIQQLTDRMREERAKLDAELSGFDETGKKANKVAGIVAQLNQEFADGKFDDKKTGKKPTLREFDNLVEIATQVERKKELLKEKTDAEAKRVSDLQKATSFIEGMRPQVEQAMELLLDPLGVAKKGTELSKTDRWISQNADAIKAKADELGKTVDDVKQAMRSDAAKVDSANVFSKVEEETRRINASMVSDSRDAAVQRMKASNQELDAKLQNYITLARAAKMKEEDITRLEKIAADNRAAHAAEVEKVAQTPMQKMAEQWQNTTKNMEEATTRWANSSVDVMTNFVKTGKLEFSSLVDSIITDLIRIQIQKTMSGAISSGVGFISDAAKSYLFADGGIMTSSGSMPLKKYAAGGIANSPQMAVFGEGSMNEAYVPLPDGRTIPVTMTGGSGGNVNISIVVNNEGASVNSDGDEQGRWSKVADKVRGVVREEMLTQKRPGGILSS